MLRYAGMPTPASPSCCIIASIVDDSPMLSHKAVLVISHDVDELHVDALAGRCHAHQLTLVSSRRPHTQTTLLPLARTSSGPFADWETPRGTCERNSRHLLLVGGRPGVSSRMLDEAVFQQGTEPVDVSGVEQVIKVSLRDEVVHRGRFRRFGRSYPEHQLNATNHPGTDAIFAQFEHPALAAFPQGRIAEDRERPIARDPRRGSTVRPGRDPVGSLSLIPPGARAAAVGLNPSMARKTAPSSRAEGSP